MLTLIKNGYVIDPSSGREGIFDILIQEERIIKVGSSLISEDEEKENMNHGKLTVIDAKGKYVMPGFVDLHVHLREPGFEYKETIETGSLAAAAGGFTTICSMPNTNPVTDSFATISDLLDRAKKVGLVNILPIGSITVGQAGKELADILGMKKAGAVALSEDGKSVMDPSLYMEAMKLAVEQDLPIFAHCEDSSLVRNGAMNEGARSQELGIPGIGNIVEDLIVARDILLAKETGAKLHICHCSTKDSVKFIAMAKKEGLSVTGEVCPHHFTLTDADIPSKESNYKMNPPLRSEEDLIALKEALRDGVIDVIATDHAPHSEEEKSKSFLEAPFGIVGLETAFALTNTELVKEGYLTARQMVEKMSLNPARILGIDRGSIGEGKVADIVIADPKAEYQIDKNSFRSKGKNTPFHGRKVFGRVEYTFVNGRVVYQYQCNKGKHQ